MLASKNSSKGYQKSVAVLQAASTPHGFVASKNNVANYQRIWTRDSMITGIAALLTDDVLLIETFKQSIITIFNYQHKIGFMPSNAEPAKNTVSYGGTVGRVDNVCWAVIGLLCYAKYKNDNEIATQYEQQIYKCFALLDAWEFNGKGLVYVPQSGDWADEYIQHGYILYDQLLRVWALELAALYYHREEYFYKQ